MRSERPKPTLAIDCVPLCRVGHPLFADLSPSAGSRELKPGLPWLEIRTAGSVSVHLAFVRGRTLRVNFGIVMTAGTLAAFFARRPPWLRAQRWIMGGVLGALAARLALARAD